MSNWITITDNDVLTALSVVESTSYRTNADLSETDPLPSIITQVVGQVRGAVRSHSANVLPTDDTLIPVTALHHALAIIRHRLLANVPDLEISEARRDEYREALAWLNLVRKGEETIPSNDETAGGSSLRPSVESISSRSRTATREKLSGL
jgi:hypothetical protein